MNGRRHKPRKNGSIQYNPVYGNKIWDANLAAIFEPKDVMTQEFLELSEIHSIANLISSARNRVNNSKYSAEL